MRLLVTGGAGFIGSAFCRHIIAETTYDVLCVDRLVNGDRLHALASVRSNPRFLFRRIALAERDRLLGVLAAYRPDAVVHLASQSEARRESGGVDALIATNVVGTCALLESVRGYWESLDVRSRRGFRFIHSSSDAVFGTVGSSGYASEATGYAPSSPYAATKAASDHIVRAWHHTYGLPAIIASGSNTYGPYQGACKLVPQMVQNALAQAPLVLHGDGLNVRDWLYVDDYARALHSIVERGVPGETYTVGGGFERTTLEVVTRICLELDRLLVGAGPHRNLIRFDDEHPQHDRRHAVDPSKLRTMLGWRPLETFEQGIARTVAWYVANGTWWSSDMTAVIGRAGLKDHANSRAA